MAARRRSHKPRSTGGRIATWLVRGLFIFVFGSVLWVLLYRFVPPPITLTQVGDVLGGRKLARQWTPIEAIDRDMVRAAIAAEDGKYCSHHGFDADAIAAAMYSNAKGGKIMRGGSTISQQTAKNAFLWQGGGFVRKGFEAWFTLLIENLWSKRRIMEVYLNIAETGIGTYGVEAGARRYFNKSAASLSPAEAARIAAILPLPKRREAVAPTGFTRRYGNSIAARIRVVGRDGLDSCVYQGGRIAPPATPDPKAPSGKGKAKTKAPERIEDYIDAPDIGAPVAVQPSTLPITEPEVDPPEPQIDTPAPAEPEPSEPAQELNGL